MAQSEVQSTKHIWGFLCSAWIHPSHVGYIIGKSGTTIRRLSAETGCLIQTVYDSRTQIGISEGPVQIQITGYDTTSLANAYTKLMMLAQMASRRIPVEEPFNSFNCSQIISSEMMVPVDTRAVGFIIGKNGNTINKIGCDTSCVIKIQYSNPASGMNPWFRVRGTNPHYIREAAHRINTIEQEAISRLNRPKFGVQNLLETANIKIDTKEKQKINVLNKEDLVMGC